MTNLPDIPLLIDGDGYLVELNDDGRDICIVRILLFPNNENAQPRLCEWRGLLRHIHDRVINAVNRKYRNRMVKISC
jgi:hypothetical protein